MLTEMLYHGSVFMYCASCPIRVGRKVALTPAQQASATAVCRILHHAGAFGGQGMILQETWPHRGGAVAGKVLVTGRDVNIRTILEFRLEQEGYTVVVSKTGPQALEQACREQPDLIILDLAEPHEDGLDFLERVRSRLNSACVPIIVLSTFRKEELDSKSTELQDAKFLLKPFSPRELVADVHRIISSKQSDTGYSERQRSL